MRTSTAGVMAIASHEGIVLSPYLDSVGVWTLGIGHTAAAGFPDPKTFKGSLMLGEAIGMFRHDLLKYEDAVNKAVKVPLKQYEFDALVSFHYNTGAIGKASFVKKLNAGDRAGALKGIMDWRKPAEIIPRRTVERDLFKTGKYPEPVATIYPAVNGKVQWKQGKRVDLASALNASPAPEPISTGPISGPPSLGTPIPSAISPAKPVAPPVVAKPDIGIPITEQKQPVKRSLWAALADLISKLFGRKPS